MSLRTKLALFLHVIAIYSCGGWILRPRTSCYSSRRGLSVMAVSSKAHTQEPFVPALRNVPFRMKELISRENIDAVRFRHIQLGSEAMARRCEDLMDEGEMDFDTLARTLSLCAHTRDKGGDFGWVSVRPQESEQRDEEAPAELVNACCHMNKGDLRVLSRTTGAEGEANTTWHVLQLMDVLTKLTPKERKRKTDSIAAKTRTSSGDHNNTNSNGNSNNNSTQTRTYTLDTMGCQMNVADSERMEAQLVSAGYTKSADPSRANVVIVNTCSIRDHAEQKVYSHLGPHAQRKKKGEDVTIIVAGCVAQQEGEQLMRRFPGIDVVMGPQYTNRLLGVLESALDGHQVVATDPAYQAEDTLPALRKSDISAFVNVIYGCNEHCTYCVVPTTRGVEQSRTKEAILEEVKSLVESGYKEITLLGQNIDAWGRDMTPKHKFADLLAAVAQVPGLLRLRFLTSHPKYMSKRVIDAVAKYPSLMPCFYVPFQAGSSKVLKMMRRGYTHERFLEIVANIREQIPDASIIADCIVGFPGETEEQFQESLSLMEEVKFDSVNTAAYSPRPGTPAALWNNQVSDDVKQDRHKRIQALMTKHALERSERYLNTVQHVLVEDIDPKHLNCVSGRNPQNRLVFFQGNYQELRGKIVPVLIKEARPFSLTGTMIANHAE